MVAEGKPLYRSKRHTKQTHERWTGETLHRPDQCGICVYWVPLTGHWGLDYGACTNPSSERDKRVTFEHDGCDEHRPAKKWIAPVKPPAADLDD